MFEGKICSYSRAFTIRSPTCEQDLSAAMRLQRLRERFLELVEWVDLLHCGPERSLSDEVAQLLVHLPDLCARRIAYPIDQPEAVEAETTVDELAGRHGRKLPTEEGSFRPCRPASSSTVVS